MLATYVANEIFPNLILITCFPEAKGKAWECSKSTGMEVSSAWPLEYKANWFEAIEGRVVTLQPGKEGSRNAFFESCTFCP